MTAHEYHIAAMRTANPECKTLSNVGLGIAGEAGEVADVIKKHLHHNHILDKKSLAKELGDVAWYIALGCEILGYDFEDILQMNVDKLKERYPDGFDTYRSIHRKPEDTPESIADTFARNMADISIRYSYDPEKLHIEMDDLMCETLEKLGCGEGVQIFLNADKYYA